MPNSTPSSFAPSRRFRSGKSPFYTADPRWWDAIAAALPLPWAREAVLMDLRWWADQERVGRQLRPGRRRLAERWGWSEYHARNVIADAASWVDEHHVGAALAEMPKRNDATNIPRPNFRAAQNHAPRKDSPTFAPKSPTTSPKISQPGPAKTDTYVSCDPNFHPVFHPPETQRIYSNARDTDADTDLNTSTHPPLTPPAGGRGDKKAASKKKSLAKRKAPRYAQTREGRQRNDALTQFWRQCLNDAPAHLVLSGDRGPTRRRNGTESQWPTALLQMEPQEAQRAVAAVVDLCKGTPQRKARPLNWQALFGKRGEWADAYAWESSGRTITEPRLGRDWRMRETRQQQKAPRVEATNGWGWG